MGGKWQKNFTEGTSGAKVDELLQVSSLQRLARERIVEMEVRPVYWHASEHGALQQSQSSIIIQSPLCFLVVAHWLGPSGQWSADPAGDRSQIVETEETFELVWHIPLNGSASKISKTDRYLKNGEVVEAARRDGRPGVLRSQLTFTPEGHVHIRCRAPPCLLIVASF